jgi:hypothetical protein
MQSTLKFPILKSCEGGVLRFLAKSFFCVFVLTCIFLGQSHANCVAGDKWQELAPKETGSCNTATGLCQGPATKYWPVNGAMFAWPTVSGSFACTQVEEAHLIAGLVANCTAQNTVETVMDGYKVFETGNQGYWASWSVCNSKGVVGAGSGGLAYQYSVCPIGYTGGGGPVAVGDTPMCSKPIPCPVEPLKPITDPIALQFENGSPVWENRLSPDMAGKLQCLRTALAKEKPPGSIAVNSAWRPKAYQDHLFEIKSKLEQLKEDVVRKIPACIPIRNQLLGEKRKHGLGTQVGATSKHSDGAAFDANWSNITTARLDELAATCKLSRPIRNDPIHFQ